MSTHSYQSEKSISRSQVSWLEKLHAYLVVSRWEYMPVAIGEVGIPATLALLYIPFNKRYVVLTLWGLLVWWAGHYVGSQINCLNDYAGDCMYKKHLAEGVDVLGRKTITRFIWIEAIAVTLLIYGLGVVYERPLLTAFWLVGLAFGYLYSVKPIRLKSRVWWKSIALGISLWLMPMLFAYYLLTGTLHSFPGLVLSTFVLQIGLPMFLIDEVSDLEEDRLSGDRTASVVYGRYLVMVISIVIYVVGSIALLWVLLRGRPVVSVWPWIAAGIAALCYLWVIVDFARIARASYHLEHTDHVPDEQDILEVKQMVKTPTLLVATCLPLVLLLVTLFA